MPEPIEISQQIIGLEISVVPAVIPIRSAKIVSLVRGSA
jgi:hypothetical protein